MSANIECRGGVCPPEYINLCIFVGAFGQANPAPTSNWRRLGVMIKLDESKLAKLKTADQLLDEEYGKEGTPARTEFHEKAMAWYYGEILRDRRKELKMTQKQLAQKIGKEQSYIARVEKGEVDMQLSSFFRIARALNIELTPSFN